MLARFVEFKAIFKAADSVMVLCVFGASDAWFLAVQVGRYLRLTQQRT